MQPFELQSSNLDLLEIHHQLVSDQHPSARTDLAQHGLYVPPEFLSRTFCQAYCLDYQPDPNSKLVTAAKSAISSIPGLCYVTSLNTDLSQTIDIVSKLGLFPHNDSTKNFYMQGKLTNYGSHFHMERNHAPISGDGRVGWKFSLFSFIRGTIIGTVCYFTGAIVGSQPEFRAAYEAQVDVAKTLDVSPTNYLQSLALDELISVVIQHHNLTRFIFLQCTYS